MPNKNSYDEYLCEDGFPHFWIQWTREEEAEPLDLSCISYSNYHLGRYIAMRDWLVDELDKHGGYKSGYCYFDGCTKPYELKSFRQRLWFVIFGE